MAHQKYPTTEETDYMVQEHVVQVWDDVEKAKGRKLPATLHVEMSLVVKDLDGKVIPAKSLGQVEYDCSEANLDTLVSAVGPIYKLPDAKKTSQRGSGSSSPRRPSSGSGGGSKSPSKSSEVAAFNSDVREWAATQSAYAAIKPKGRLPGEVIEAYKEHLNGQGIEWERKYFPSRFEDEGTGPRKQDGAAASTETGVDTEPGPAPQNTEHEPDQPGGEAEEPDPPMDQTRDEDWTRGVSNEPVDTGAYSGMAVSSGP